MGFRAQVQGFGVCAVPKEAVTRGGWQGAVVVGQEQERKEGLISTNHSKERKEAGGRGRGRESFQMASRDLLRPELVQVLLQAPCGVGLVHGAGGRAEQPWRLEAVVAAAAVQAVGQGGLLLLRIVCGGEGENKRLPGSTHTLSPSHISTPSVLTSVHTFPHPPPPPHTSPPAHLEHQLQAGLVQLIRKRLGGNTLDPRGRQRQQQALQLLHLHNLGRVEKRK